VPIHVLRQSGCLLATLAVWHGVTCVTFAAEPAAHGPSGRAPATSPAELPPLREASTPMSHQYDVLLTRSIFARDKNRARTPTPERIDQRPETTMVLRGVMDQDGTYTAFVEDTSAGKLQEIKPGDPVARGRVARITLGGVEYESSGLLTRVGIGANLDGVAVAAVPAPQPSPQRAAEAAAQPAGAKSPPGDKTAASERVAKARQKRQASGG
jgi:hypothetical protein